MAAVAVAEAPSSAAPAPEAPAPEAPEPPKKKPWEDAFDAMDQQGKKHITLDLLASSAPMKDVPRNEVTALFNKMAAGTPSLSKVERVGFEKHYKEFCYYSTRGTYLEREPMVMDMSESARDFLKMTQDEYKQFLQEAPDGKNAWLLEVSARVWSAAGAPRGESAARTAPRASAARDRRRAARECAHAISSRRRRSARRCAGAGPRVDRGGAALVGSLRRPRVRHGAQWVRPWPSARGRSQAARRACGALSRPTAGRTLADRVCAARRHHPAAAGAARAGVHEPGRAAGRGKPRRHPAHHLPLVVRPRRDSNRGHRVAAA
eukprot:1789205-Prymnesium_polylepis.1